jgi:hypothetical protein
MSGAVPVYTTSDKTYEVNAAVTGGQLVMPDTGGKIKPATTGTVLCLGVAKKDAIPTGTNQNPTGSIQLSPTSQYTAVGTSGVWRLTAQGAINFGDAVIVGSVAGTVAAAGATPDARTLVGKCVEPLGIVNGAVGEIMLGIV